MAGLQRSVQTFRRSGSSGMVWHERFLSEEEEEEEEGGGRGGSEFRELRHSQSVGSSGTTEHRRNDGRQAFRAGAVSPAVDPPSPDVSGCLLCGIFGKPRPRDPSKPRRRQLRRTAQT
ncbi:hypothetical protein BHE74_00013719 [Ensete ventricosum]|nr:hypothetical protein GW17_00004416 [Ensete ventricosum]RWW78072.1 hypothetical protein BHE74_00013719 [Ensete ventricosum]RZR92823.1 hypothetical protein BHM03_00021171 [Ensete ventricosum]